MHCYSSYQDNMKKLICLLLAAFTLASVSSVNAAGFSKHHHGARHAAASHHKKGHHAKSHHHKRA
jgi:hypothetical protein